MKKQIEFLERCLAVEAEPVVQIFLKDRNNYNKTGSVVRIPLKKLITPINTDNIRL